MLLIPPFIRGRQMNLVFKNLNNNYVALPGCSSCRPVQNGGMPAIEGKLLMKIILWDYVNIYIYAQPQVRYHNQIGLGS